MTADLFISSIDEDEYGTIFVDLTVSDHLRIMTEHEKGNSSSFVLPPSDEGLSEARALIDALNVWIEKIEESRK